ncbi:MAG: prepilin peptidase [Planctomycetota bacterium]|nr:MAG: prepilin peptidase [Planctomycetota bacterium]
MPLPARLAALFVVGVLAGAVVNWLVDVLAWEQRSVSPWTPRRDGRLRRWGDYVPVVGWFLLRREAASDGRWFWIRPLGVELFTGAALAALYWWETQHAVRLPPLPFAVAPAADFLTDQLVLAAHVRFAGHALLVVLMLAASLIDLDEQTIPDSITVGGASLGLVLAAGYPWSLLPEAYWQHQGVVYEAFLTLASPTAWPARLDGLPALGGLGVALFCWTLWCGGLMPRYWNTSRGYPVAARVFMRHLLRYPITFLLLVMWLAGSGAIALVAWRGGAAHWAALVSSLVGLAAGGGIIWAVRNIGGRVLDKEAMGFGDVTLMAMIGVFLGWQACLIVFFVAPFFGLLFAVGSWVVHRERAIPYGPFLCLGAVTVMLYWPACWDRVRDFFDLWWLVPAMIAGCLVMLGVLLWLFRLAGQALGHE